MVNPSVNLSEASESEILLLENGIGVKAQTSGKPIGSGRMEKGVDHVIGQRQKKKALSWSPKGSKALALLKVVELNGRWQSLWFPDEQEYQAAA